MSKYGPLAAHLRKAGRDFVPLTFDQIEGIVGAKLPASAFKHRAWWSNNPSNSTITHAWLNAGYRTADVDMPGRRLVFRKAAPASGNRRGGNLRQEPEAFVPGGAGFFSCIFGALKGTVTLEPGTDLTSPTGEKWGAGR